MKPVLELLAASALSVGMVIGGVVVASAALSPEEEQHHFTGLDIADLWTSEPIRVNRDRQNLERLPPRYASHVTMADPEPAENIASVAPVTDTMIESEIAGIDLVATSAVSDVSTDVSEDALPAQHISWCESRYRSYDAASNTYRSFSGQVRDCESPHLTGLAPQWEEAEGEVIAVSDGSTYIDARSSKHTNANAHACMDRYRSYRVEDNSYQPYGGGPRQQCELVSF